MKLNYLQFAGKRYQKGWIAFFLSIISNRINLKVACTSISFHYILFSPSLSSLSSPLDSLFCSLFFFSPPFFITFLLFSFSLLSIIIFLLFSSRLLSSQLFSSWSPFRHLSIRHNEKRKKTLLLFCLKSSILIST